MKKYLYILIGILCIPSVCYTQSLNVHTTDGSIYSYEIADIDSITFTISDTTLIYLINDDFESYDVGSFPSSGGWFERYNGSGQNIIDNALAHSGTKSFRIQGQSSWAACIENHDAGWQSYASKMGYEIYIYTNDGDINVNFIDYQPLWGWAWGMVEFATDGNIYAAGNLLMPYTYGEWYKVKVQIENIPPYNYEVWIDDLYMGEYTPGQSTAHSINESYFEIRSGHAGNFGWFDDAKVWYISSK